MSSYLCQIYEIRNNEIGYLELFMLLIFYIFVAMTLLKLF